MQGPQDDQFHWQCEIIQNIQEKNVGFFLISSTTEQQYLTNIFGVPNCSYGPI